MLLSELVEQMAPPEDVGAVFRKCCSQCGLPDGCDCAINEIPTSTAQLATIITEAKREAREKRRH